MAAPKHVPTHVPRSDEQHIREMGAPDDRAGPYTIAQLQAMLSTDPALFLDEASVERWPLFYSFAFIAISSIALWTALIMGLSHLF